MGIERSRSAPPAEQGGSKERQLDQLIDKLAELETRSLRFNESEVLERTVEEQAEIERVKGQIDAMRGTGTESPFIREMLEPKEGFAVRLETERKGSRFALVDAIRGQGAKGRIDILKRKLDNQEYETYYQASLKAAGDSEKTRDLKHFLEIRLSELEQQMSSAQDEGEKAALLVQLNASARALRDLFVPPVQEPQRQDDPAKVKKGFWQRLFGRK